MTPAPAAIVDLFRAQVALPGQRQIHGEFGGAGAARALGKGDELSKDDSIEGERRGSESLGFAMVR